MSTESLGALPKYAERADRIRVVKILCKKDCRTQRFAELNKAYPGKKNLWAAPEGEYEAVCLKCNGVAKDHYNWFR